MSGRAIKWARRTEVRGSAKMVLLTLATYYRDEFKKAWPSYTTLVQETGLSRRTIERQIEWLIDEGFILRKRRAGGNTWYLFPQLDGLTFATYPGQIDPSNPGQDDPPHPGQIVGLLIHNQKQKQAEEKLEVSLSANADGDTEPNKDQKMKLPKGVKVGNVVKAIEDAKEVDDDALVDLAKIEDGKYTAQTLASVWKGACAKYSNGYLPQLTGVEVSQLGLLNSKLGEAAPGYIVLAHQRWDEFVKFVFEHEGYNLKIGKPKSPRIGFVLKHANHLHGFVLALHNEEQAEQAKDAKQKAALAAAKEAAASKPLQSIAQHAHYTPDKNKIAAALAAADEDGEE